MERTWGFVAAGLLIAGGLTTAVVAGAGTPALGEDVLMRWVQGWPGWLEPVARAVRLLTETEVVLGLGAVLVAGMALAGDWRRAVCFGVVLVALPVFQAGMKDIVDRDRPTEAHVEVRDSFTSPSYPAGHVMSGTLLWGYVTSSRAPRRVPGAVWWAARGLALGIIVLGPWANVYMGVHWPTDVLGGLLLGGALAAFAVAAEAAWAGDEERPPTA